MSGASDERTKADNAEEVELLASLQNPDINVHDIYSALVREGLFDAGDEILVVDPASGSDNPAVADLAERPSLVSETVLNEDEKLIESAASPSEKDEDSESSRPGSAVLVNSAPVPSHSNYFSRRRWSDKVFLTKTWCWVHYLSVISFRMLLLI